jgi:hypothetical protein
MEILAVRDFVVLRAIAVVVVDGDPEGAGQFQRGSSVLPWLSVRAGVAP